MLAWYANLEIDIWQHRRELHTLQGKLLGQYRQTDPTGQRLKQHRQNNTSTPGNQRNGPDGPITKKPKLRTRPRDKGTMPKRKSPIDLEGKPQKQRRLLNTPPQQAPDRTPRPPPRLESAASTHARIRLERYRRGKRTRDQIVDFFESYRYQPAKRQRHPP